MKYIDSEKLLAEIKIIQQSLESRNVRFNQVKKIRTECMIEFCKCIIDVIESLQQEQSDVDLEKEIGCWMDKLDNKYCILVDDYSTQDIKDTARHFFELGLKAFKIDKTIEL